MENKAMILKNKDDFELYIFQLTITKTSPYQKLENLQKLFEFLYTTHNIQYNLQIACYAHQCSHDLELMKEFNGLIPISKVIMLMCKLIGNQGANFAFRPFEIDLNVLYNKHVMMVYTCCLEASSSQQILCDAAFKLRFLLGQLKNALLEGQQRLELTLKCTERLFKVFNHAEIPDAAVNFLQQPNNQIIVTRIYEMLRQNTENSSNIMIAKSLKQLSCSNLLTMKQKLQIVQQPERRAPSPTLQIQKSMNQTISPATLRLPSSRPITHHSQQSQSQFSESAENGSQTCMRLPSIRQSEILSRLSNRSLKESAVQLNEHEEFFVRKVSEQKIREGIYSTQDLIKDMQKDKQKRMRTSQDSFSDVK